MDYIHPSQMTDEQRRENTAALLDRFARAHDKVAARGEDTDAQRESARNARRAASKIRNHSR
jgi:hypothetical protein